MKIPAVRKAMLELADDIDIMCESWRECAARLRALEKLLDPKDYMTARVYLPHDRPEMLV